MQSIENVQPDSGATLEKVRLAGAGKDVFRDEHSLNTSSLTAEVTTIEGGDTSISTPLEGQAEDVRRMDGGSLMDDDWKVRRFLSI